MRRGGKKRGRERNRENGIREEGKAREGRRGRREREGRRKETTFCQFLLQSPYTYFGFHLFFLL